MEYDIVWDVSRFLLSASKTSESAILVIRRWMDDWQLKMDTSNMGWLLSNFQ